MDITALIAALIMVESAWDPSAIGDDGRAVGILQQHPIFVEEVNRILGRKFYRYMDRYDVQNAIEMSKIWLTYHQGRFHGRYGYPPEYYHLAMIYNRGWTAYFDACPDADTDPYWLKVKLELERIAENTP